jgi:hypothetical protein
MDKSDPPVSFGVFKPVGHTVIAFRSAGDLQDAASALRADGFAESALVRYSAAEMAAQVNAEAAHVSPLAAFSYELNFIAADRALAERGCSFLVVHAPDSDLAARVAAIVLHSPAVAARHYGRFTIEELIAPPAGATEVSRSPAENLEVHAALEPSTRKPNR